MRAIIVAYDHNRVIGNHGNIPWMGKMRGDMRHFREKTTGHPIIMGRTTYDLIGALPNRTSIVITRQDIHDEKAVIVHSLDEALREAEQIDPEVAFILGGAQIYQLALDTGSADTIYATEIDTRTDGDAFFPTPDMTKWRETSREHHEADEQNIYDYDFVTYKSRAAA